MEQAVRDYYAAVNRAIQTGDLDGLRSRSTEQCGCRALVAEIEKTRDEGSVEGGLFTIRSVTASVSSPNIALAEVVIDATDGRVVNADGRVIDTIRGLPNARNRVTLVRGDQEPWRFNEVEALN